MINEFVLIKNDIIQDETITDEGVATYILLKFMISERDPLVITTNTLLSFILCDSENRTIKNGVIRGLQNLEDLGIVEIENTSSTIKLITVVDNKVTGDDYYLALNSEDFFNFFKSKNDRNSCLFKMFRVYLFILSSFNRSKNLPEHLKSKFCILSQYYFQDMLNIKQKTLKKYIDFFQKEGLLYIFKAMVKMPNEKYSKTPFNVYTRYEYKDIVEQYISSNIGNVVSEQTLNDKTYKAKMCLYYNNYMKRGYKLTYEQLMELVDYFEKFEDERYSVDKLKSKIERNLNSDPSLEEQKLDYDLLCLDE